MSTCIDRLGVSPADVNTPELAPDRGADHRDDGSTGASAFAGMLAVAITPTRHPSPESTSAEHASSTQPASRAATASGTSAPESAPSGGQRELARLAPELRRPLERVLQRMQSELGHHVTVLEATSDQARQKVLFAQGRPALGSLKAWTGGSSRLDGLPAGVLTEGASETVDVYQQLARIAHEEGLAALAPLNAEHGAIPAATGAAHAHVSALASAGTNAAAHAGAEGATAAAVADTPAAVTVATVAAVATVPPVSTVATVATVGQVAQVAVPAAGSAPAIARNPIVTDGVATDGASSAAAEPAPDVRAANGAGVAAAGTTPDGPAAPGAVPPADATTAEADAHEDKRKTDATAPGHHESDAHRPGAASMPLTGSASSPANGALRHVGPLGAADVVERIARVLQLQATATSGPLSHVVLRLDSGGGGSDLIRVGIRENSVDATLTLRDPTAAGRAHAQIGELQQALGRRGLTSESLQVQFLAPEALKAAGVGGQVVLPSMPGATLHQRQSHQAPNGHTPPRDQRGGTDPQSSRQHSRRSPNKGS